MSARVPLPLANSSERVGAFPHAADAVVVLREDALELPVDAITALVLQDLSACQVIAIDDVAGAHDAVEQAVIPGPDLGVAEVLRIQTLGELVGIDDRIALVLEVVHSVAEGDALRLAAVDGAVGVLADLLYARVHEQMTAVGEHDGAAREDAVVVVGLIGRKRCGQMRPMQQVGAHRVSPVHGAPLGIEGIVLVEQVVLPLIEGEPVGVVHPADTGGQMVDGPIALGNVPAEQHFVAACRVQGFAVVVVVHNRKLFLIADGRWQGSCSAPGGAEQAGGRY